ncbi:hypothetical protein [Psychrobacter sp. I-STPA10]|uniref:hypothetical protein n=1 Tax=Psychrobacter sp. I-STPA10 TaxID=2585769 RepID=UPI001E5CA5CD|nr:hypothetical protein [Psychrobacter sp. I-STPA10]
MALTYSKGKWVSALSLSLLCVVSMSGCSKKDKDTATTAETDSTVETQVVSPDATTVIPCDDATIKNTLSRSIKELIAQQSRTEISKYATQVGANFDMAAVNGAMNDIIIDFATPTVMDSTNSNGMQTCQTSLSLTLPSENIYLANEVYNGVEGKNMQQTLAAANVRLSNNMLVDDAFTYVVGMQGGQAVAKVVGQPAIIRAVADIMAKSQLKEMVETSANSNHTVRPIAPVIPRPPAEPRIQDDTTRQNRQSSNTTGSSLGSRGTELQNQVETIRNPITSNTQDESVEQTINENRNAAPSVPKANQKLNVPTDDSMDMVIIEEDVTY